MEKQVKIITMVNSENHYLSFYGHLKMPKYAKICQISKKKIKNQNKVDNHREDKKMNNVFFCFFQK